MAQASPTRFAYLAVAFGLSALLLYYSFQGLDWASVWATLRAARPERVALWILATALPLFLRAKRWRVLLGAQRPVSLSTVFWATCAGYFGNSFLPARAGELVRTMVIRVKTGLSATFILTTAIAERISDASTLVLISALVLLLLPSKPVWLAGATRVFVPLGLGGALAIILLPLLEKFWRRAIARMPAPHSVKTAASRILDEVLLGAAALHNPGRLLRFVGLTLVVWAFDGLNTVIGGWALGILIPVPVAFLLIAALGLSSALPSTPGYVGIYQFVAVSVLTPFGISRTRAIAFILLAQAIQYLTITAWGLLAFSQLGGLRQWTRRPELV